MSGWACRWSPSGPTLGENLTYADPAGRLGTSREAARSLVRRLRLPRQTANDGTVRINVDLSDIQYKPVPRRSPRGHGADFEALKAQIEQLQAEVTELETEKSSIESIAARHRADFERERERGDNLMANTMSLAAAAMSARMKAARLESELTLRGSQFWVRLSTGTKRRQTVSARQASPNQLPKPEVRSMQVDRLDTPWSEPPLSRTRTLAEVAALMVFAGLITVFVEYGIPFLTQ
jgi:hypothetical protein